MARPLALNLPADMTEAHPHHHHHPREPHPAKPSLLKLLLEARAPAEWWAGVLSLTALGCWPRGDGHPVLIFPGLAANDWSTVLLRQALSQLPNANVLTLCWLTFSSQTIHLASMP